MYQVLYRKWRPKVFGDVVGQPHITRTLLSEVRENRLAHAYLFTGSRGTGKTTCAKILSKAINCLNPQNGNPCNECEICRGVDNGTLLDVTEIDAASNRGIDDIRLLRDESNFTPAQATYRVYIIDEVHMLTIEAFNALLKTLEEPPEHVKFILATTEVHKLPSTILSRCQRFDFRRIEPKVIAERLMFVAQQENAVLHEDAAMLIARIADGGMRDALSLLDSAISVSPEVTAAVVSDCAGLMGRDAIHELVKAVASADTAACLSILDRLHNASCDTERLIAELTNQFRNFLICKTVQHPENLIVCTQDELNLLCAMAQLFSNEQILFSLNVLTKTAESIKRTQNRRIEAEMALIRLCSPETDSDTSALLARISMLEEALEALKRGGIAVPPAANAKNVPSAQASRISEAEDIPPFEGFGQETPAGGYANAFSGETEDDEPVDPATLAGDPAPAANTQSAPEAPTPRISEEEDIPPFEGFGQETPAGGHANAFSGETEDDEPLDPATLAGDPAPAASSPPEKTAQAPAAAPVPNAPVKDAFPAAGIKNGPVDKKLWFAMIKELYEVFTPVTYMLTGSEAYISDNAFIVKTKIPLFIEESEIQKHLDPIIIKYFHRSYMDKIKFDFSKKQ